MIGDREYVVAIPERQLTQMLYDLPRNYEYKPGDVVLNYEASSGDHLFVDRFAYNFVRPKRGNIFVFETKGIPELEARGMSGQFYIKRCVGLPKENISIHNDDRIYINDAAVPAEGPFEKIYSEQNKQNGYYGHLNYERARQFADLETFAHLVNEKDVFSIPPHAYWAMGDNTRSSLDSRYIGPIPERNLVGRAFFVYWPFGKRWGMPE